MQWRRDHPMHRILFLTSLPTAQQMFSPDDSPEHLCHILYLLQATKHLPARPHNKPQTL